jgi:hypothetical protein
MRVAQVAPEDSFPVMGYELRTLECPQCGDTERRLAFSRHELSDAEAALSPNIAPPATTPAAANIRDERAVEPAPAVYAAPGDKWEQAVEKVRMRRTVLALEAAAQKAQETPDTPDAVSSPPSDDVASDDFDRVWEGLARLAPLAPLARLAPLASPAPLPPRAAEPPRDMPDAGPPVAAAASDMAPAPKLSERLWTRAVAMLRSRFERAASQVGPARLARDDGGGNQDAILRIDADALKLPWPKTTAPRAVPINMISANRARARR